jgi:hypothetical protein
VLEDDDIGSDTEIFTAELDEVQPNKNNDVLDVPSPQSINLAEYTPAIPPLPELDLDLFCEIISFW